MNFSEPIKSHNGQAVWSEDGYLLASASGPRLPDQTISLIKRRFHKKAFFISFIPARSDWICDLFATRIRVQVPNFEPITINKSITHGIKPWLPFPTNLGGLY